MDTKLQISLINKHLQKLYDLSDGIEIKKKAIGKGYIDQLGNITPSGKNMVMMMLAEEEKSNAKNYEQVQNEFHFLFRRKVSVNYSKEK